MKRKNKHTQILQVFTWSLLLIAIKASALQSWTLSPPRVISEQGRLAIVLSNSNSGGENLYIVPLMNDSKCKNGVVFNPKQANSARFNGTLIKLADACDGNTHYFYPLTSEGSKFLISLFLNSSSVYLLQGDFSENISAQGFSATLNAFRRSSNSTGGL